MRAAPGDEGHERPDNRHEPAQDDGLAAVLFEKRVRARQVIAIEQPMPPSHTVGGRKHPRPDPAANGIVHGVAGKGCDKEQHDRKPRVERARARGKRPDRKEQGVTREDRRDDQSGLANTIANSRP
jgi:hypothetical protein